MKNNTRLISAVLAAVLCGASLAACARTLFLHVRKVIKSER